MTATIRKVRAGAPVPADVAPRETNHTAMTYLERAAADSDAVSEWAAANPSKHTKTPAEREADNDYFSPGWRERRLAAALYMAGLIAAGFGLFFWIAS